MKRLKLSFRSFLFALVLLLTGYHGIAFAESDYTTSYTTSDSLYSITYTNRNLDAVLIDIAERMNIDLAYNPQMTRGITITISLTDRTAEYILNAVARQAGLRVQRLETGTYAISRPPPAAPSPPPPPPPKSVITGHVIDSETLLPLQGVMIFSAGKVASVHSDSTGHFLIGNLSHNKHVIVSDHSDYYMTFMTVDIEPGDTTAVIINMRSKPEIRKGISGGPVLMTAIYGMYTPGAVFFPDWMRSGHDSWIATLPGVINVNPLAGYSNLSRWSSAGYDASHGLFLFTGRIPDYSVTDGRMAVQRSITGGRFQTGQIFEMTAISQMPHAVQFTNGRTEQRNHERAGQLPDKLSSGYPITQFPVQPAFSHAIRPVTGGEMSLSAGFIGGGISAGERPLLGGMVALDASARFLNPPGFGISPFKSHMRDWMYAGYDSHPGGDSFLPVEGRWENHIEATLAELGMNLFFRKNERFKSRISLHTGRSDVRFEREYRPVQHGLPGLPDQNDTGIVSRVTDQNDASYTEFTAGSTYLTGAGGRFFQELGYIHSGFDYSTLSSARGTDRTGTYNQSGFNLETGYIGRIFNPVDFLVSYDFSYSEIDAGFSEDLFEAGLNNQSLATHALNLTLTANTNKRITISPGIRLSYNIRSAWFGTDPSIHLGYRSRDYPYSGYEVDAEWRQITRYSHSFLLPVSSSAATIPFYEITMAPVENQNPAIQQMMTAGIRYILNESAALRLFLRFGTLENHQSPDFRDPVFQGNSQPMNSAVHLTDTREFRAGGVIYGRLNRPEAELSVSYSYGELTELSSDRFGGARVQSFGNVPHHLQSVAQVRLFSQLKMQLFWESRTGIRERALHEKYYTYSIAGDPDPGTHKLDSYHRLDAGITYNHQWQEVNLELKFRLMNILNHRNHMDTVLIADFLTPEPSYRFQKRWLPGMYPEFEIRFRF